MNPIQDKYPHFEANQVLTSDQLNQVFEYLDEQQRLTRANLIGIGIECGLEISLETNGANKTIRLEKGCGVTSAGFLIVEPDAVDLVAYQDYILPLQLEYPQFKYSDGGEVKQYPLWELFPDGQKNTKLLGTVSNFLTDKTVILFLELKKEGLRNCSSNNCDDKGEEVTAIVRRLLIKETDLAKIIAKANQLGSEFTFTDVEAAMMSRINLPDIRVPRHILPDTATISSNQVLAAFHEVFHGEKLALTTATALTATYEAFKPLVLELYPTNPFEDFAAKFGALDRVPSNTSQVRFLQYYCDFFDDIIQAYDEFRWKGVSLMCACCPPEELFPRHLMLGSVQPLKKTNSGLYRHHFLPSAAISDCEDRAKEVVQLFQRMVEMTVRFTNDPTPPDFSNKEIARKRMPVRVTPSKLADVPLSEKAIPYYYLQDGKPPLYHLWNIEKTQRNRANQNQGFRWDEYFPAPPTFISNPLKYNLEPYNFLRIEGHLGKKYKDVLSALLKLKQEFRLPIEIIALRTGVFDARMKVDLTKETCHFEDLEALYDALRDELVCSLGKTLESFYSKKVEKTVTVEIGFKAKMVSSMRKDFMVKPSTFGAVLEKYYATRTPAKTRGVSTSRSKAVAYGRLQDAFINESPIIRATASFAEVLLEISDFLKDKPLSEFDLAEFQDLYDQLETLNENIKSDPETGTNEWNELFDQLEAVHYANQLESFKSIAVEYDRRVIEVKKKQFFGDFLKKHPGVQHKSGVPMGGTFIVVYHDDPTPLRRPKTLLGDMGIVKENFANAGFSTETTEAISIAFSRIQTNTEMLVDPDIQLFINEFSKKLPSKDFIIDRGIRLKTAEKIISETVNEFSDGTVIADFYLPYICCSDCAPIQYILPAPPLSFTVRLGCTNENGVAEAFISSDNGSAPFNYQLDGQPYELLNNSILLSSGEHTIRLRDSNGAESVDQMVQVPLLLNIGEPVFEEDTEKMEYIVSFPIFGGKTPYTANTGTIKENTFISNPVKSGETLEVVISDDAVCKKAASFEHTIVKPLEPLVFTVKLGCTDGNGMAEAIINCENGTAPYQYQLDDLRFLPLKSNLLLNVGPHTIRLLDSLGAESLVQTLEVLPQIEFGEAVYEDDVKNMAYTVSFIISGGLSPYKSDSGIVERNDTFISDPIASGKPFEVTIGDHAGCKKLASFEPHTVTKPCDLPCDGQSRKSAFRLWIQPPSKGLEYETYDYLDNFSFTFNGIAIKFSDTKNLLRFIASDLNKSFDEAMTKAIENLNQVINEGLINVLGSKGKDRLTITYQPDKSDPFGVLWIEHFVCDIFNFSFDYSYAKPTPSFILSASYFNEKNVDGLWFSGMNLLNTRLEKTIFVPSFAGRERNLCLGTAYQKLCVENSLKPSFTLDLKLRKTWIFQSTSSGLDMVAWVWDVFGTVSNEPFFEGEQVEAQLALTTGLVHLTVISAQGCFEVAQNELPKK